jgi:hypothetical protein
MVEGEDGAIGEEPKSVSGMVRDVDGVCGMILACEGGRGIGPLCSGDVGGSMSVACACGLADIEF